VLSDRLGYGLREPRRGELAVVESPATGQLMLKRVVVLAGDRVEIRDGSCS
jgi:hypothetical protein